MKEQKEKFGIWKIVLFFFIGLASLSAQTTGKIAGKITDASTGKPIPGANVIVEGTDMGAASDENGNYYIINLPPGDYSIRVQVIGYVIERIENVHVSVNRTTFYDVALKQTVIEGETVIVEAEKVSLKKDQTSTTKNISAEQMEILPVENIGNVISMQAGVVAGHFRGGRDTEVSYMVDGIKVDELYDGKYAAVDLEPEAVKDLEVITGTFNAEYGQAMSGVVNLVTRDGGNDFHASVTSALANYFTSHKDIFIGLKDNEFNRNQDYKLQVSGPIIPDRVTFFANYRYQNNKNHLNGIRRFNVTDSSNFNSNNPSEWYSEHTGDSAYVPMNNSANRSFMAKLAFYPLKFFKISVMYNRNDDVWHNYNHGFKYNPDGRNATHRSTNFYTIQINHMVTSSMFYELKLSRMENYNGWYLFKNPLDSRYVHDKYLYNTGPGFYTGGQEATYNRFNEFLGKGHSERYLDDNRVKFDLTWQANRIHGLKAGFEFTQHRLDNRWHLIRNKYEGTDSANTAYAPIIFPDSTTYADVYVVKPWEYAAYIQDKMEFDEMVINMGIRYDYFNPEATYPSDRRNPANQLNLPDSMSSVYPRAPAQIQISPRFGLAYQLGSAAVLHFSYGHFFQTPPLYALYQNHAFIVSPKSLETTMGNALVKAQKTVSYEVGLWQEMAQGLGIEVALFYRDIYNLLSTKIVTTYNQIQYGLYTNKDYGNARGLEVKLDYFNGPVSIFLNYTLQYTRGNADTPEQNFNRAGNNQDPVNRYIPMSWDQRHTLNLTVGYNRASYGISLTGYYNSGTPYTFSPLSDSRLAKINLYPNNDYKSPGYSVDMNGYVKLVRIEGADVKLTWSVYNLFDRLNEVWVNGTTGRAYTAVVREVDRENHRSDFNEYEDTFQDPSAYVAPRLIKVGITFGI